MSLNLTVHDLTLCYDACPVLDGVEFKIQQGEMVALLGANGAGKSTLLRCISSVLEPTAGFVYLNGCDIQELNAREIARTVSVVPQSAVVDFDFTVEEIVLMGRFPHVGRFRKEKSSDISIAREAMEMTAVNHLADRLVTTLSGGEKQRVMIARAICQKPKMLLLDEPTANLDILYQSALLDLAAKLNHEKGVTVIAAIHDINLATQFFDRLLLLANSKIIAAGSAEEVITVKNIEKSYGVSAHVFRHPLHGRPQVSVLKKYSLEGKKNKMPRAHIIGGGEDALPVLDFFRERNFFLSVGPVTAQDSSYRYASFHKLEVIEVLPFSVISDKRHADHLRLLEKADLVVVPPVPFGVGNLSNLEAVEKVMNNGLTVFLIGGNEIGERDYTGGIATAIFERMKERGAILIKDMREMAVYLRER